MNKIEHYQKLIQHRRVESPIISLQLNLTTRCVNKCIMCNKHQFGFKDYTYVQIEKIIKSSPKLETVVLSGGEPLLHKDIYKIISLLKDRNIKIGILTSAAVKNINWKIIFKNVEWCRISCDGWDEKSYEDVRGVNTFNLVYNNLKEIIKIVGRHNKKTRINFTYIPDYHKNNLMKIRSFASELGFDINMSHVHSRDEFNCGKTDKFKDYKCAIVMLHAIVEADRNVYPCCILMDENAKKINTDYFLGSLEDFDYNLEMLWYNEHSKNIRETLYLTRISKCINCTDRYHIANMKYNKNIKEDKRIFL